MPSERLVDERLRDMVAEDERMGCIDSHTPHEVWCMATELLELRQENERLRHAEQETRDAIEACLCESCTDKEEHCTCVPYLRIEVARLRRQHQWAKEEVEATQEFLVHLERENDRLQKEVNDGLRAIKWHKELASKMEEELRRRAAAHGDPDYRRHDLYPQISDAD